MTPARDLRVATSVRAAVQAGGGLPEPLPWVRDGDLDVRYVQRLRSSADPARTMSVIIPSWNSESTLAACVSSVVRATAAIAAQCHVEVIVVDDESRLPASDALDGLVDGDVQVIRIAHSGQAPASNTGAARATGELLVFCDSDMLLNPWALSELRNAVAYRPNALCFGFRENVSPADPRVDPEFFRTGPGLVSGLNLLDDNRFGREVDEPGVPVHLFAATHQLADLTGFRVIRPPGRTTWWLARMAYGALLACSRAHFLQLGGFDGRFVIWGYSDTELATRWIASGRVLLPVFSANALHVRHPTRDPHQWRDAGRVSRQRYERMLAEDWPREPLATARTLSMSRPSLKRAPVLPPVTGPWEPASTVDAAALTGDRDLFEETTGLRAEEAVSDARLSARALRVLRLSARSGYLDATAAFGQADAPLEQGLLALALGDTDRARRYLEAAARDPAITGGTARYLLGSPAYRLWRIAEQHRKQGLTRAAASGFLACRTARGGERYPQAEDSLALIAPADRRVY